MVAALFDTNILIDYLNGVLQAREELGLYEERAISIVTWMEVMVGAPASLAEATRSFLSGFEVIQLDEAVAGRAVELRRIHRMKLPDAIIWSSAEARGAILITHNIKDFPPDNPGFRMPYLI